MSTPDRPGDVPAIQDQLAYRAIFQAAPFAVALTTLPEGLIADVNAAFLRLFEFDREEVIGRTSAELGITDEESRAVIAALFAKDGRVRGYECSRRTRSGAERTLSLNLDPFAIGGRPFCLTVIEDVTERRRAEQHVREGEDRLALALEAARQAPWDLDLVANTLLPSPRLAALYGLPASADLTRRETWRAVVVEEDVAVVDEAVAQAIAGGDRYEAGFRIRRADTGEVRRMRVAGIVRRDEHGQPRRLVGVVSDVTDRWNDRHALEASEQFLAFALATARIGTWDLDIATRTARRSHQHAVIFGDDDALAAWSLDQFLERVVPEDRERVRREVLGAVQRLADFSFECAIERTDGERRRIWVAARPRTDATGCLHMVGTIQDITERAQAADAQRRLASIVTSSEDAIWTKDLDGTIQTWNPAAARLFGYAAGEIVGTPSNRLIPPDKREEEASLMQRVEAGEHVQHLETVRVTKDGRAVDVSATISALRNESGNILGASVIVRDISDRKRAEEHLRELDRRKDEFIAVLSHELRNPLAPIRYAIPILQGAFLPDNAARAVEVIERQVTHLARLVDDLLDVSRITAGKLELQRDRVTLGTIVRAAVEAAAPAIAAGRHSLTVSVPDESIWVYGDQARLSQVITNLLDNSAKYTPRDGQIEVVAAREGDQAVVHVRDNGVGIPAESLSSIFEMFHQVNRVRKVQGGLGVGLGLAKQLIAMHDGTIEARSGGPDQGAAFIVRLPLARDIEQSPGDPRRTTPSGRSLKILIVDDNADLVEMLAAYVESSGHDVRKAFDGVSAVAAAVAYRPDVVLLDLGLPGMNGLAVARELRRRAETANAYLVAVTGWGQPEDLRDTREAGFDSHLTKPTDPEALEKLLSAFSL